MNQFLGVDGEGLSNQGPFPGLEARPSPNPSSHLSPHPVPPPPVARCGLTGVGWAEWEGNRGLSIHLEDGMRDRIESPGKGSPMHLW